LQVPVVVENTGKGQYEEMAQAGDMKRYLSEEKQVKKRK
jgi:hypothetical protein